MLRRIVVGFASFLAGSPRYTRFKRFFHDLFENTHKPYKKYFDILMIFIVVSSIFLLIQEVNHDLPPWLLFYNYEVVTVIFLTEYLLRMWVYSDIHKIIIDENDKSSFLSHKMKLWPLFWKIIANKLEYVRSPAAIIDLLAILPSYRPLRVLRVFLLFRVIKLLRYTKSLQSFMTVLYAKKFELFTLLIFLAFIVFISGVLIYVFEGSGQNENITDFFHALYWALVTISTVGYGDISPVTVEGRAVSMIVIIAGIGILSFATSIIVSAFTERLDELKSERSFEEAENLKRFYLVCGYSSMAQMVTYKLKRQGFDIVVIDRDKEKVDQARQDGHVAIHGEATKLHTYHEMNLYKVERIIAALTLISDEVQNIYITLTLKSLSSKINTYARAQTPALVKKLYLAGADHVLYPFESIGKLAHEYIQHPIAFDALTMMIEGHQNTSVNEIPLFKHDKPVGKKLKDIDFFALRLILLGVKRDGVFIFNPGEEFLFRENDIMIVVGKVHHVSHLKDVVLIRKGKNP